MFQKVFEYAGPHKKKLYQATFIVLLSVLMGVLPFGLAYQVISPFVMAESIQGNYILIRVVGVLFCLVLQAVLYGWGLDLSHKATYNTLLRLRTSLQKRLEVLLSLVSITVSLAEMMMMYSVGMKKMGPYYQARQKNFILINLLMY